MKKKHLKLSADQIETLIESTEGCIATDAITTPDLLTDRPSTVTPGAANR